MRIWKTKLFAKWAAKEGVTDAMLQLAVDEIERGLIDADLGSYLVKKRVALAGRGKSGGARTIVVYQAGDRAFFVYGFAKNAKANIQENELKALRAYAAQLVGYSEAVLVITVKAGALIEVEDNE